MQASLDQRQRLQTLFFPVAARIINQVATLTQLAAACVATQLPARRAASISPTDAPQRK